MDTLTRYFKLSDQVEHEPINFEKLVDLFAQNAKVTTNTGTSYEGLQEIRKFFQQFFQTNVSLRHIFEVQKCEDQVIVQWGVVGRKAQTNKIFALTGKDIAKLNNQQQIVNLKVITN